MNDVADLDLLELDRFAIGQPVSRSEDPVLVSGTGRFTDDVNLPGQAYAEVVRSHHAHGLIRDIDAAAARGMPGVLGVYTAADLEAGGVGPLPPRQVMNNRDGTPMLSPLRHALAKDKVRHVGEAVAAVVAETPPRPRMPPRRSSSTSTRCRRSRLPAQRPRPVLRFSITRSLVM